MAKLDLSNAPNEAVDMINNHDHSEIGKAIAATNISMTPTGLITKTNVSGAINDLTNAGNIGITPIVGLQATTVQAALSEIKNSISTGATAYGIEWNKDIDTVTRIGLSKDGDRAMFDSIAPWSLMRRCNLRDDGVVLAYQGDPLFKSDGSYGQVMVEIPAFYERWEYLTFPNRIRMYISATPQTGFTLHPAFSTNGVVKTKVYFSAYEGFVSGAKLESKAGVVPTVNLNIAQFRTLALARGTGWQQQTYHASTAVQLLLSIEYASFDSQSAIGLGVVNTTAGIATGGTLTLGNASGMAQGTNGLVSVSYRGIENFWGNYWTFVDGINIKNYTAYIADHGYASDVFVSPYTAVSGTAPTASGYMSDILDVHGFLPKTAVGSSTTRYYDYYYAPPNTGNFVVILGGYWNTSGWAGAFYWRLDSPAPSVSSYVSSRLLFV